jgi:hypothetical protein
MTLAGMPSSFSAFLISETAAPKDAPGATLKEIRAEGNCAR